MRKAQQQAISYSEIHFLENGFGYYTTKKLLLIECAQVKQLTV